MLPTEQEMFSGAHFHPHQTTRKSVNSEIPAGRAAGEVTQDLCWRAQDLQEDLWYAQVQPCTTTEEPPEENLSCALNNKIRGRAL